MCALLRLPADCFFFLFFFYYYLPGHRWKMNDTLVAGLCMQISGRRYGRGRGEPNDIRRREKLVLLIGRGNIFSRQHQDAGILIDGDPVDKIKENIDLEKNNKNE